MEARVKFTVPIFLEGFFVSYKTMAAILSDPYADNYVISETKLIYGSLMLQILGLADENISW